MKIGLWFSITWGFPKKKKKIEIKIETWVPFSIINRDRHIKFWPADSVSINYTLG